jgi:thiol-disulfide isomerase/thioredoxin
MTRRFGIGVGMALLAVAALGLVLYATVGPKPGGGTAAVAATGPDAPLTPGRGITIELSDHPMAVPVKALTDLDGKPVSIEAARGKVVLLNFWATWCGPCREEIPTLVALQQHYADKLMIVGISIDTRPPAEVKTFASELAINYPIVMSTPEMERAFGGISSVPATFVVNRDGQIVQRHIGTLNPPVIEHEIRSLAGLPTDAVTKIVKDTGQVLLGNAAYATEIPGVDLSKLTPAQKEAALKRLNTEDCTCGCGLTLAQCRINDPTCDVSLPLAQKIAQEAAQGGH